jgi:hypothetical protein
MKHPLSIAALAFSIALAGCSPTAQLINDDEDTSWQPTVSQADLGPLEHAYDLVDHLRARERMAKMTGSPVLHPLFDATSAEVILDGHFIYVYEFADASAAEEARLQVAEDGRSVNGKAVIPEGTAHFYQKDHLIVLYVGDDASVVGNVGDVLGEAFRG